MIVRFRSSSVSSPSLYMEKRHAARSANSGIDSTPISTNTRFARMKAPIALQEKISRRWRVSTSVTDQAFHELVSEDMDRDGRGERPEISRGEPSHFDDPPQRLKERERHDAPNEPRQVKGDARYDRRVAQPELKDVPRPREQYRERQRGGVQRAAEK